MQSVDRNRDSLCKLTSNNTVSSHPISTGRTVKLFWGRKRFINKIHGGLGMIFFTLIIKLFITVFPNMDVSHGWIRAAAEETGIIWLFYCTCSSHLSVTPSHAPLRLNTLHMLKFLWYKAYDLFTDHIVLAWGSVKLWRVMPVWYTTYKYDLISCMLVCCYITTSNDHESENWNVPHEVVTVMKPSRLSTDPCSWPT